MTWANKTGPTALTVARNRAAVMAELRRLMPGMGEERKALPFGLGTIDSHLPDGGLTCGALHEVVPQAESCIAAAFGFIAAILGRISSPPPPGPRLRAPECTCWGGARGGGREAARNRRRMRVTSRPPTPPSPTRGEGAASRFAAWSPINFHRAGLWAAPLPPARPVAWPWPQRARSRSGPPHSGRDRAPQGNPVGHGGGGAVGGAGRRRRRHRHARSEIEPAAASRRHRGRSSAFFIAAGAPHPSLPRKRGRVGRGQRGGDALAHRHRASRARPFRPRHAAALALATRALPQRTAG